MGVVNYSYLSVTSTATPINQDSNTSPSSSSQNLRPPTRIILPNKKLQKWSTGMAPGEYGGPPTITKLRKYWGGEEEDPLTSDDFIWNKDFMSPMKRLIQDPLDSPQPLPVKEVPSGFLSLNRVMSLDSLEVDLSKELTSTPKPVIEKQADTAQASIGLSRKWRPAPTRCEQEKWDRATKSATGGSFCQSSCLWEVMFRELRRPTGDPQVQAAESREQYFQLKNKLQTLTVVIGGVGLVSAYLSYSPEIAASYGAGFLGSLAYMRMLGNSIDSLADGTRGIIKGAIGQPRLLVPVVLVMVYNRWNGILVPEYGFMHLDLIPMLVGFFTYKIATFTQAIEEALTVVGKDTQV